MKPHLLDIREKEGRDVFFDQIRNCVAVCRQKWKTMAKASNDVCICNVKFAQLNVGY